MAKLLMDTTAGIMIYKGVTNTLPEPNVSLEGDVWEMGDVFYMLSPDGWIELSSSSGGSGIGSYTNGMTYNTGDIIIGEDNLFYRVDTPFTATEFESDKFNLTQIGVPSVTETDPIFVEWSKNSMQYKGNVDTYESLPPIAGSVIGDVWSVAYNKFYILNKEAQWQQINSDNFSVYENDTNTDYKVGQIILGPDDAFYRVTQEFESTDWDSDKDKLQIVGATGLGIYQSVGTMNANSPDGTVVTSIMTENLYVAQKKNGVYCSLVVRSAPTKTITVLISSQQWYGGGAEQLEHARVILTDAEDFEIDNDNGFGLNVGTNGQVVITNIDTGEQYLIFCSGSASEIGLGITDKYSLIVIPLSEVNIGIPQGDRETGIVTDITLTGNGLPSNPLSAENSLIKKSDIYNLTSEPITKNLLDVSIGDDISNGLLTFPTGGMSFPVSTPLKGIVFENGNYWGCSLDGQTWGLYTSVYDPIYIAYTRNVGWTDTSYTLPDDCVVYSINSNAFLYQAVSQVILNYTPKPIGIDCEWLYNNDLRDEADFETHRRTDVVKWNDTYGTKLDIYELQADDKGLMLGETEFLSGSAFQHTCTDEYGGIIEVTMHNTELDMATVVINGTEVDNLEGMPNNIPITKYYQLKESETIIVNYNVDSAYYTPIITNPNAPYTNAQIDEMMDGHKFNLIGKEIVPSNDTNPANAIYIFKGDTTTSLYGYMNNTASTQIGSMVSGSYNSTIDGTLYIFSISEEDSKNNVNILFEATNTYDPNIWVYMDTVEHDEIFGEKALGDHIENDKGYWATLLSVQNMVTSNQALLMQQQEKINDLSERISILEENPVEPDPVYDMSNPLVLKTPPLIGLLGIEVGGTNLIGSGWTAPSDGMIIVDGASTIGLLTPTWIAVNGNKVAPSGSITVLTLIGSGSSGQFTIKQGDVLTESGMGNVTYYSEI